jgi:hypothetical protein
MCYGVIGYPIALLTGFYTWLESDAKLWRKRMISLLPLLRIGSPTFLSRARLTLERPGRISNPELFSVESLVCNC